MTVGELKKILNMYDEQMPVYLVENGRVMKSKDFKEHMILGIDEQDELEYFLYLDFKLEEPKNEQSK